MARKAMRLMRSEGIPLKEAWAQVKSGKGSKRRSKRSKRSRRSRKGSRRSKRSRRGSRRGRKSRRFGLVAGPGFKGQTSYANAYSPYFGSREPFVAASEWWAPVVGGVPQYPGLAKSAGPMKGPGN